jgi:hypothetical protein
MDDGAFAAEVRRLTGKETNTEALQILRGGALGIGPDLQPSAADIPAAEPAAVEPAAADVGTKVDPSKFAD